VDSAGFRLPLDWKPAALSIPHGRGQGVFLSEPTAQDGLRKRSLLDQDGNVLPVISVFDHSPP
jgi:arabinogalactan endo-1,4-beta-galactosidase